MESIPVFKIVRLGSEDDLLVLVVSELRHTVVDACAFVSALFAGAIFRTSGVFDAKLIVSFLIYQSHCSFQIFNVFSSARSFEGSGQLVVDSLWVRGDSVVVGVDGSSVLVLVDLVK